MNKSGHGEIRDARGLRRQDRTMGSCESCLGSRIQKVGPFTGLGQSMTIVGKEMAGSSWILGFLAQTFY